MSEPQLRLTEADPDLRIAPEPLLKRLGQSLISLEDLCAELRCTPDDIRESLDDSRTAHLLKLKVQLAAMQVKLLALECLPQAVACLASLTRDCPKPEVARRSATSLVHLSGIATTTKASEPEALPAAQDLTDDPASQVYAPGEAEKLMTFCCHGLNFERNNFDFASLSDDGIRSLAGFFKRLSDTDPKDRASVKFLEDPEELANLFEKDKPPHKPCDLDDNPYLAAIRNHDASQSDPPESA